MVVEESTASLIRIGGSTYVLLSPDYLEFISVTEKNDKVGIAKDFSKHGRFLGIWNPDQKKRMNDLYKKVDEADLAGKI